MEEEKDGDGEKWEEGRKKRDEKRNMRRRRTREKERG